MNKLTLPLLLSLTAITSFAQKQLVIHGKIALLSTSKSVHLTGYDPVPIRPDGSFEIKGEVTEPGTALIFTDSSGASAIWLEAGEYTIDCKEITLPNYKPVLFRSPTLKGPADAELYNDFQNRQYSGYGKRMVPYIDSILKINDHSPALPEMIRLTQGYAGDETTKEFIQRLAPELRNSSDITQIENGFKRKEKVNTEKIFENFTLEDTAGSNFSLASLSGKRAILIDFWSSSCGACRLNHPKLVAWYNKYAGKGLQIISISIDDNRADWLKAIHEDGIGNWINVCDPKGWKAGLMQDYYIAFIPFSFLLDGDRKIVVVNNMVDSWIREKDIAAMVNTR